MPHYIVKRNADGDLWAVGKDLLGNITIRLKTGDEEALTMALPPLVANQVAMAILDITTRKQTNKLPAATPLTAPVGPAAAPVER